MAEAKKKAKAAAAKKPTVAPKRTAAPTQPRQQNGVKKEQTRQPAAKKTSQNGQAKRSSSAPAKKSAAPVTARNVTIKVAAPKKTNVQATSQAPRTQKAVDPHKVVIRVRPAPTATTKTTTGERNKRAAVTVQETTKRREQVIQDTRKAKSADSSLAARFATVAAR